MLSSATGILALRPGPVAVLARVSGAGEMSTFDELATIYLTRCYFERYDMILGWSCELVSTLEWDQPLGLGREVCYLGLVEQLYRYTNRASHDGRLCVTTIFVSRSGVLVPANELELVLVMEVFLP